MKDLSNSEIKELDLVELVILCLKYKKIIIFTLLFSSIMSFTLIFYSTKNKINLNIKDASINILINEDYFDKIISLDATYADQKQRGLIFERSITEWKEQFNKRLSSSLNYEEWSDDNKSFSKIFLQTSAQKLSLSQFNTIILHFLYQDYLNAAVSYITHTVEKQQGIVELMIGMQNSKTLNYAKFQLKLLNEEVSELTNQKSILENEINIITKYVQTGELLKKNYISQLINLKSKIKNSTYMIQGAKIKINLSNQMIKTIQNSKKNEIIKLFKIGKINTINKIPPKKTLLTKYPLAIYSLAIIFNIFVFVFLVLIIRAKEEFEHRFKKNIKN